MAIAICSGLARWTLLALALSFSFVHGALANHRPSLIRARKEANRTATTRKPPLDAIFNVGILNSVSTPEKKDALLTTVELLERLGCNVYTSFAKAAHLASIELVDPVTLAQRSDMLLTQSGDRLHTAAARLVHLVPSTKHKRLPIFAVNYGRIGNLAPFLPKTLTEDLTNAVNGLLPYEERGVLHIESARLNGPIFAANEVMIEQGRGRMPSVAVFLNGEFWWNNVADGVMVATPFGTHGHYLSSGGNIAANNVNAMFVHGVASQTGNPAITVHGKDVLMLKSIDPDSRPQLSVDGITVLADKDGNWAGPSAHFGITSTEPAEDYGRWKPFRISTKEAIETTLSDTPAVFLTPEIHYQPKNLQRMDDKLHRRKYERP